MVLTDKKINETGTIRRVCSLIDLSTPMNDGQSYGALNGGKYCTQRLLIQPYLLIKYVNSKLYKHILNLELKYLWYNY